MGRTPRVDIGGYVYHVLNRANGRDDLFEDDGDYEAFERVLALAVDRFSMRLLCYCLMPNHWHLLVYPRRDGDLSAFMQWLTLTHTQRVHAHRHDAGRGHVYQGRYKSFLVSTDRYFFSVARYVERNALQANLVKRADAWQWSSLWRRRNPRKVKDVPVLSPWPVERPRNWLWRVNQPETTGELESIRRSVARGRPFGNDRWVQAQVKRLGLASTVTPRGRPPTQ